MLNNEFKLIKKSNEKNNFTTKDEKKFNEFLKNGILTFNIDNNLYKKLLNHLNDDILELKNMKKQKMEIYERGYLMERIKNVNKIGLKIIHEIAKDLDLYSIMNKYYTMYTLHLNK